MKIFRGILNKIKISFDNKDILANSESIGEFDKCPHCKNKLDVIPKQKKKCQTCGNYIYSRTRPSDRKKVLVTEKQAKEFDVEWSQTISLSKWKNNLIQNSITDEQIEERRKQLSKRFKQEASYNDTIWSLLNDLVVKYINDNNKLAGLYYSMALFLNEEGKNPFDMLYQSKKMNLMNYRNVGLLKNVEIISAKKVSCPECNKFNGKIYKIEEALREMPLPNKKCSTHLHGGKFGFCRCVWAPHVID